MTDISIETRANLIMVGVLIALALAVSIFDSTPPEPWFWDLLADWLT